MKNDAVATLTPEEKVALKPILEAPAETVVAHRGPGPAAVREGVDGRRAGPGRREGPERVATSTAAGPCSPRPTASPATATTTRAAASAPTSPASPGRFSPRDLLESIVEPSKAISDQYAAVTIATTDGRVITGRIVNLNGDNLMINTDMLDPNAMTNVNRNQIEEMKPSQVSMMPEGLLDTLKEDEILDLMAYLLSRGDRQSPMFR